MSKAKKKGKKGAEERVPLLGRPGNNVKMGIVGMPNVGKSTTFNIMSGLQVPAENYSFCTLDPNVARVQVPDERFDFLVNAHKPKSEVPAMLTITDIAGLVKGANEGHGLGNEFLSNISAVDGIYHTVRAFKKKSIEHVEGSVDPVRDLEIISEELRLKDIQILEARIAPLKKKAAVGQKGPLEELEVLERALELLKDHKDVRHGKWSAKDIDFLNQVQLLSAKPVVFLVNVSKKGFLAGKNKWIGPIREWVDANSPGSPIIPYSADLEQSLADMDEEARAAFLAENKSRSMMATIITTGYHALSLVHYFTCGADEVKCWTIREGTKAPGAAGVIHTDFEKNFICAEVMAYEDFKEHGDESAVKAAGKYRQQGRNYVVQDGDIIFFKFGSS